MPDDPRAMGGLIRILTAPDRPEERSESVQQQADRATAQHLIDTVNLLDMGGAIAAALAAARAEEAARWRAKIEALPAVGTLHGDPVVSLRALLEGGPDGPARAV